ncbi:hypothetical protein JIQ42_06439 [Leishmania sp. Namibia]|uniref:hypothetical protein n=1 Tax=Leishmania sp. Namibia TaxID=2802991 RepID=UPI001B6C4A2B|nr:hypothetical protein JIQ42_06439 [Leishmania sp. Namibia]
MVFSIVSSPSAPVRPSPIPTRATAAADAFITSIGLHPIEPIHVVGLSSGEVCLYTAGTDALSWFVEMEAARQAQLRLEAAAAVTMPSSAGREANGGGAGIPSVALPPPENPDKVLCFNTSSVGGSIVHCGFLRGREEDLQREVVQRLQPSLSSAARHLLYAITSANDVYVVDMVTEAVVLHWVGGGSASGTSRSSSPSSASPLSSHFIVTQAETYGALMFLTVARRSAVRAVTEQAASRGCHLLSGGAGPERNMYQHCNEPAVYVLHLGYTSPLAASTPKGLIAGGGAHMIKATPIDKPPHGGNASSAMTAAAGALSIRAHPFAPLLLLLLNRSEVQVYAIDGDGGKATPKKAQLIFTAAALSSSWSSGSGGSSAPAPAPFSPAQAVIFQPQQQPVLDAQFIPSAAVLVPCHGAGHSSSSSPSRKWICRNVQVLLVTPTRLRLLCTRAAATMASMSSADDGDVIAVDRAFYAAPPASAATSSSALSTPHVTFLRAWTWLGSPDSIFALQSDRVLVELSCNDFISASMDVPSVRSRRPLPPRTVTRLTSGDSGEDAGGVAGLENWWLTPLSPPMARSGASATAADGVGVAGLSCVQWPDVLPLWGRSAVLSGVFVPRLPASLSEDPHTLIFSRLTGLARPVPIRDGSTSDREALDSEDDPSADTDVLHVSLMADTDTISSRCICVRLCLTPQPSLAATSTATRPGLPLHQEQESVNVSIARLLCDFAAPALFRLEHGFYFVGSRSESAYADYPFLIAGLLYLDSVLEDEADAARAAQPAHLRAAIICLPADKHALRRLYELARRSADGDGAASQAAKPVAPSSELKRALLQTVRQTQVEPLPVPHFDFEVCRPSSLTPPKQLLSCAFQLSNDGVVPCVWGLWAPRTEEPSTSASESATAAAAPPPPQHPVQLIMQTYYVAADTQQLRWRPPELVHMSELLVANPSQVFALSTILTGAATGVASGSTAAAAAVSPPYKSVEDALLDVDPAVVARLFLYYADRKVLVLATVERGSSSSTEMGGMTDGTYNFASRTNNGRARGRKPFTAGQGGAAGEDRQNLCLVPHAAAEMNGWKEGNSAESLSCSLLTSVQLSAVMVSDHGDPALQVAVVSRRFGVALATFPLVGRRGVACVSASLLPVKVQLYRRWDELLCSTAAKDIQAVESEGRRRNASRVVSLGLEEARKSALLRRYRAWVDTVAHPASTYVSVPLALWVWSPAWPGVDEVRDAKGTSAAAAASPVLLLQRGCTLCVLHVSGAAAQVCASLPHCSPLRVAPRVLPTAAGGEGGLYLQHGASLSLVAHNRLLRQLQLHYARYSSPIVAPQTAAAGKAKWFKIFLRQAQSDSAARLRLKERPQLMEWLQRVYAPGSSELAYESPSTSSVGSAKSTQMSAALEQLTGAGVTHIGDVLDVSVTHSLRLATLEVEALAAGQGMQQLILSARTLTAPLRQSLQHITAVLERDSRRDGEEDDDDTVVDSCTLRGSWAVAEALAQLPLACVTRALSREAVHAAANAEVSPTSGRKAVTASSQRRRAAELRRWLWLVVRSGSLVSAVNEAQADKVQRELSRILDVIPITSALLRPVPMAARASPPPKSHGNGYDEADAADAVAHALLLCSPQLMPQSVTQLLQLSGGSNVSTPSQQQQQKCLRAAVGAALEALGANDGVADASGMSPFASLFSTVRMDGAHWTHAVYYTNLLGHLRHLASQEAATEPPVRELASQCIKSADADVENSAAAVLEVAAQTIEVLLGDVAYVPAASRSRMETAVAQSVSKRQQLQQHRTGASRRAASRSVRLADDSPLQEGMYFLEESPVDQQRHRLYKAQWRHLYGTFAYPTRYFFRSTVKSSKAKPSKPAAMAAASLHHTAADLPYQLLYNSRIATAMQQTRAPRADPNNLSAATNDSALDGRQRRVRKVLLTEQPVASDGATAPPPAMELVPVPSASMPTRQRDEPRHGSSTQQQSTPLSLRAAVAHEEAALQKTYFDAFEPADEREANAGASQQLLSPNSAGYDLSNDSLLQRFRAQLRAGEAEETVSASTTQRLQQEEEERQHIPGPSAFAPSATRAATASTGLYGVVPTQQEFFTRFASDD